MNIRNVQVKASQEFNSNDEVAVKSAIDTLLLDLPFSSYRTYISQR